MQPRDDANAHANNESPARLSERSNNGKIGPAPSRTAVRRSATTLAAMTGMRPWFPFKKQQFNRKQHRCHWRGKDCCHTRRGAGDQQSLTLGAQAEQ